jgi:hypothetical protein
MDRRERINDDHAAMLAALNGERATLWTALPAIVQSFDAAAETITAQPSIQARVRNRDGSYQWVDLPVLVDVPVVFQGGGGFTLTFEPQHGDEALIVFASRCIDNWWLLGGVQEQAELRMHDLSDGFALVGLKSQPRTLAGGVKPGVAQLRADDGGMYIELAAGSVCNIVAPGGINITGPVNVTGTVHITDAVTTDSTIAAAGTITAPIVNGTTDVKFGGKSGIGHKHGGVSAGTGTSGVPT